MATTEPSRAKTFYTKTLGLKLVSEDDFALVFDAAGNLFSTTYFGGAYNAGTMFELTPATGGSWTETIVHSFGSGTDGRNPNQGGPIIDSAGNLYDMTVSGGTFGGGTVYEITP